jgi:hypothetical protein
VAFALLACHGIRARIEETPPHPGGSDRPAPLEGRRFLPRTSGAEALRGSVAIPGTTPYPVAGCDHPAAADQVDMSMISRILARAIRELADQEGVRPERVARFQELPRQNAHFDDPTTDRIFRAMRG